MPESMSVLRELDDAISRGSAESRLRALWHATDLLMTGRYTEEQIWIFGEVIGRLAEEIEVAARTKLAVRLARTDNAPFNVVHKLAFDDSIDVAGPILRQSERLDARALVANARTKSQQHLLAISRRRSIDSPVTDVLVTRGNREVVASATTNGGARFSEFGFLQLLKRSEGDSILTETLGRRADIPRHVFQQLIAKASEDVKRKLASERPELGNAISSLVTDVTGDLHSKFGPASRSYFSAKRSVSAQHRHGNLDESRILEYALSHKLEETTVGLSLLCSLPIDVVERALVQEHGEVIMVLAKANNFSWETTMSLLFLGAPGHRISARHLDEMKTDFSLLDVETSRNVLTLYRSRKTAAASDSDTRRLPPLYAC
ncbi:MAG: DUF2336 domain-containing protein [Xanthobacteraceae bacterium]|nr:DUF2336 domain-containing protein [Xanthobacteraceae bacterium]